jgi:dCMP deaminase
VREEKKIARGERYELCRSVHAEANAIISASRKDMLGGVMYLAGIDMSTGKYVENASSCAMCKRLIINAGIATVYIRDDKDIYRVVSVNDWIENDESLVGTLGY